VALGPGTALVPLAERLEYLAGAPAGWILGWIVWMLCAALLIAFLSLLARRTGETDDLARLGLIVAVAGAGFDLLCDSVYIVVFPMLAAARPVSELLFLTVERVTGLGSLVIANGAYSIAILLISVARRQQLGPGLTRLGYVVGVAGLVLGAAGYTGSPYHAMYATPAAIGPFCVWVVLVARAQEAAEGQP
jgi:hypothetical protein